MKIRLFAWHDGGSTFTLAGRSDVEEFAAGRNSFDPRLPASGRELLGFRTVAGEWAGNSGFHGSAPSLRPGAIVGTSGSAGESEVGTDLILFGA